MAYLASWTLWLIIGLALLILEVVVPGVFLMWWGFSAIITAIFAHFLPLTGQILLFAVFAILLSFVWWKHQQQKEQQKDQNYALNSRGMNLIGQRGEVVEKISESIIRAKFGDTTWKVQGEALNLGNIVEVQAVSGITLIVKKV